MKKYLDTLNCEHRLRSIPSEAPKDSLDLLSNDYMGLAARQKEFLPLLTEILAADNATLTSSASRLLSRRQQWPTLFEKEIELSYGRPGLLFNSGYHANTGAISALASLPSTHFVCDRLIHASAIDGLRLGNADFTRFPHNDTDKLKKILIKNADKYERMVIVVESVYSMDGDIAPLKEIVALKHSFPNVMIYLDEAHGYGVFGERGLGVAEAEGVMEDIDIIMCTLGKAGSAAGAFIVCSELLKSFFVNTARSFIFSTALPPLDNAWALMMFRQLQTMSKERRYLHKLSEQFRSKIEEITGVPNPSRSQIVPVLIGDAAKAVAVATSLRNAGFDVLPIRRPTVPPGGERIRLSLNASIHQDQLSPLLSALKMALTNG